ncbi:MAG: DMT family transporter [Candidatus Aenigmarchaeota archaeon]|nr:DMT family transporter [Candidatus Aenigmarchaeota archaeon]
MEYLWLALALFYAFAHAAVSVIDKKILSHKNIDPLALSAIRFAVNVIISFSILIVFLRPSLSEINAVVALLSTFYFLAGLAYFYALKTDDVSKLVPYRDAIVTILSFSLAFLLLGESITTINILGVIAIATGGYIVWTDGKITIPKKSTGILLIGISAVFLSFYGITAKVSVLDVHPLMLSFFMYLLVASYFTATNLVFNRKNLKDTGKTILSERKTRILIIMASAFAVVGSISLFFALSLENATKVLPIAGTLPLFAAIMGKRLLNEKHGKERIAGTLLILVGIYLLYI